MAQGKMTDKEKQTLDSFYKQNPYFGMMLIQIIETS